MKLSPAAELAIRGSLVLASRHGQGPITLAMICTDDPRLSREYLARVFGQMARAGIVRPIRGKNGGYVLSREPEQITLLQIIEAVEGPQHLNICQHKPSLCERSETCRVQKMWAELQEIFEEKLSAVNLADCIEEQKEEQKI